MLVDYSSSESNNSDTEGSPTCKRSKKERFLPLSPAKESQKGSLPKAATLLGKSEKLEDEQPNNNSAEHNGRIRTFKHERGNWATYIYIPVELSFLDDFRNHLQRLLGDSIKLEPCDDYHISLSRTVVLRHHLIESFVKSLKDALSSTNRFGLLLAGLKVYSNEEHTRTFIALRVDDIFTPQLLRLLATVNGIMKEFKLALFYDDPSFHASFLWCVGDHVTVINAHLDEMNRDARGTVKEFTVNVRAIQCKAGNKKFSFHLS